MSVQTVTKTVVVFQASKSLEHFEKEKKTLSKHRLEWSILEYFDASSQSLTGGIVILWGIITASAERVVTYRRVWSGPGSLGGGLYWSCVSSSSWRSCAGCHISETPTECSSRLRSFRTASAWSWAARSEWAAAAGCSLACGCPDPQIRRKEII